MKTRFVLAALYSLFIGSVAMIHSNQAQSNPVNYEQLISELRPATRASVRAGVITVLPIVQVTARRPSRHEDKVAQSDTMQADLANALATMHTKETVRRELVGAAIRVPFYAFGKSLNTKTE